MPINLVGGSALMRLQNNKEPLIKRLNKDYAPRIEDAVTRSELAGEQYVALGTLGGLVRNLTKAALAIQNPVINPFDKKMANITTTDTSRPNNYISVETTPKASKMSFDVRVNAVATASKMIIGKGGTLNIRSVGNMFNGELTVGVDGVNSVVKLNGGESLQQIIDSINNKFADNGVKASAISLKIDGANDNDNDKYNIVISSQELGEKVLTFNWNPTGKFNPFTGLIQPHSGNYLLETLNITGTKADITVDGRQIAPQDSNVFKDIMTGVTINALTPNIGGLGGDVTKTQTVNIGPDTTKTGVFEDINKFFIAYNKLKVFVAKMTEKTSEKDYADTAVLHNTSEIRQASYLLDSVFSNGSIISNGKYKSLVEVGIGLAPAADIDDAPCGTDILTTIDSTALDNALNNHFDDFTALFRGGLKVTTNSKRGSTLNLSYFKNKLDSDIFKKPMTVKIWPGAAPGDVIQKKVDKLDEYGNKIIDLKNPNNFVKIDKLDLAGNKIIDPDNPDNFVKVDLLDVHGNKIPDPYNQGSFLKIDAVYPYPHIPGGDVNNKVIDPDTPHNFVKEDKLDEYGNKIIDLKNPNNYIKVEAYGVEVSIPGITDKNLNNLGKPINVPILGTYTRKDNETYGYISFEGTELEGLRLQWDALNVSSNLSTVSVENPRGEPETFTIELTQGLADVVYFKSNDLMSEDGTRGTILTGSELMHSKVKKLSIEKTKLEDTLETKLDEIEMQFAKIEQMSILNDIFLDAISDIINPSN